MSLYSKGWGSANRICGDREFPEQTGYTKKRYMQKKKKKSLKDKQRKPYTLNQYQSLLPRKQLKTAVVSELVSERSG